MASPAASKRVSGIAVAVLLCATIALFASPVRCPRLPCWLQVPPHQRCPARLLCSLTKTLDDYEALHLSKIFKSPNSLHGRAC